MFLLTSCAGIAAALAFRGIALVSPPTTLTIADGLDDCWTLVRVPVTKARKTLPSALVEWVQGLNSDALFAHLQWVDPRNHPWRFACTLGFVCGAGLLLLQLQEGLPPDLRAGMLVVGIFVFSEFAAILLGFAALGGFLGLRPSFKRTP